MQSIRIWVNYMITISLHGKLYSGQFLIEKSVAVSAVMTLVVAVSLLAVLEPLDSLPALDLTGYMHDSAFFEYGGEYCQVSSWIT